VSWKNYGVMVFIVLVSSCKPVVTLPVNSKTLASIVMDLLGNDAIIKKNNDQSFALSYKANDTLHSVTYLVIRLSDLKIVEQDTLAPATLAWVDTYKIQVRVISGVIRKEGSLSEPKIIDVTKHFVKL
jgi:hypothetical protein